jgi:putative FmdB family regulatory protein
MPLYEYECDNCGHRFEVIQKFSDAKISVCPKCGGPVQKLLSSPAIQFKGSGFYLTDYGRGTSGKSESAKTTAGKAEGGSSSGEGSAAKSDSGSGSSSESKASSSETSTPKSTPAKSE